MTDSYAQTSAHEKDGDSGKHRPALTVAIQAGGESRRMGRSKATVPFLGRPLIERIVTRLAPIADEIIITTNEPENLDFLKDHSAYHKIKLVRDVYNYRGSVTGLVTALTYASNEIVAVAACDMIFVDPRLFLAEVDVLKDYDAVVPRVDKGFEPFHGVYRKSTCLPCLIEAIKTGTSSIRAFMAQVNTREFSVEEVAAACPEGLCFVNANTPDELARAEQIVRQVEDKQVTDK